MTKKIDFINADNFLKKRTDVPGSIFKIEHLLLNRLKLIILNENINTGKRYTLKDYVNNILESYFETLIKNSPNIKSEQNIFKKRIEELTSSVKIESLFVNHLKKDILEESIKTGKNHYLQHYLNNIIEYYLDNFNPIQKK